MNLQANNSLLKLELDFNRSIQITDACFTSLFQVFPKLRSLRSLILEFYNCQNISGRALVFLSEGLLIIMLK